MGHAEWGAVASDALGSTLTAAGSLLKPIGSGVCFGALAGQSGMGLLGSEGKKSGGTADGGVAGGGAADGATG